LTWYTVIMVKMNTRRTNVEYVYWNLFLYLINASTITMIAAIRYMTGSKGTDVIKLPNPANIPNKSGNIKRSRNELIGWNNKMNLSTNKAKAAKKKAIIKNPMNVYMLIFKTLYASKVMLECMTRL